jgi:hypothetical protein
MLLITLLTIKLTEVFDIIPGVQVKPKVNLSNGGIYQLLAPSNIPFDFAESLKGEFVKCALSDLDPKKILLQDDFVITNKQLIKGYSMKLFDLGDRKLIPSENIFILRGKNESEEIVGMLRKHPIFFHQLAKRLDHYAETKAILKKSQKFISMTDLSEVEISWNYSLINESTAELEKKYTRIYQIIEEKKKLTQELNQLMASIEEENRKMNLTFNINTQALLKPKVRNFTNDSQIQINEETEIEITLGKAYFFQPFFNISAKFTHLFREQNTGLNVYLGSWENEPVSAYINRLANPNHTPRIMFQGKDYNNYVQTNHQLGDKIKILISPNHKNSILVI